MKYQTDLLSSRYVNSPYHHHHHNHHSLSQRHRPAFYYPQRLRSSPYLGIFRHAPPEFETITDSIHTAKTKMMMVDGHLRGGNRNEGAQQQQQGRYPPITWLDRQVRDSLLYSSHSFDTGWRKSYDVSSSSSSRSASPLNLVNRYFHTVLRRILLLDNTCTTGIPSFSEDYFHSPQLQRTQQQLYDDNKSLSSSSLSSLSSTLSNDSSGSDNTQQHQILSSSPSLDVCVYHDAAVLREARLDYVITQVDVSRMARNASRHLDVDSILALPTITYNDDDRDDEQASERRRRRAAQRQPRDLRLSPAHLDGWSWQMVTRPDDEEDVEDEEDEDDTSTISNNDHPQQQQQQQRQAQSCIICLETFKTGDTLRVLPCQHHFHMGCIDHWLLGTYSHDDCFTTGCPTCKKHPLLGHDDDSHEEASASPPDGSVPSWAFARLGDALAKDTATARHMGRVMEDDNEDSNNDDDEVEGIEEQYWQLSLSTTFPSNEVTICHGDNNSHGGGMMEASALSTSGLVSTVSSSSGVTSAS